MNISEYNISEYMGNMCGKVRYEWDTLLGYVSKETMCNSARQNISTAGQACVKSIGISMGSISGDPKQREVAAANTGWLKRLGIRISKDETV